MQSRVSSLLPVLILGDAVVFAGVTLAGFTRHGELASSGLRMLTTFLPLCVAWGVIAPWLGVFDSTHSSRAAQLWRPILAMFLAAPMAGWLRGLWLNEAIPPIFILVIGAFSALGIILWRGLWLVLFRPRLTKQVEHG